MQVTIWGGERDGEVLELPRLDPTIRMTRPRPLSAVDVFDSAPPTTTTPIEYEEYRLCFRAESHHRTPVYVPVEIAKRL